MITGLYNLYGLINIMKGEVYDLLDLINIGDHMLSHAHRYDFTVWFSRRKMKVLNA